MLSTRKNTRSAHVEKLKVERFRMRKEGRERLESRSRVGLFLYPQTHAWESRLCHCHSSLNLLGDDGWCFDWPSPRLHEFIEQGASLKSFLKMKVRNILAGRRSLTISWYGHTDSSAQHLSEKAFWPYNSFSFTTVLNGVLGHYLPYKVKICAYSMISGLAIAL